MFIVTQFPIADARPFVDSKTHKLNIPTWPLAKPDEEFVRYTGPVKKRRKGGIKDWSGEDLYSLASRAIRFLSLETRRFGRNNVTVSPKCAFRRFFSNGEAVTRVEVAFRTSRDWFHMKKNSFLSIIESCLALPVVISLPREKKPKCDLQLAGPHLAKLYLYASTMSAYQNEQFLHDWWLKEGRTLLLVEYRDELGDIPQGARLVESLEKYDITLSHLWYYRKGIPIRVWLLGFNGYSNFDIVRRLRLNLLRLHAEQECLKVILGLILQRKITVNPGTEESNCLQEYFDYAIRIISKKERFGLPQSEILDAALDYEDIVSEGERATLLSQLEKIRKNIFRKLEKYTTPKDHLAKDIIIVYKPNGDVNFVTGNIEKIGHKTMTKISVTLGDGTIFHGDFVVAKNIEDSFNKAQESQVVDELREKLKELSSLIAKLCEQLPDEKAEEVARDLHSFVNEATSKKPRKKWYELSAKGLIEAAKTVASIAGPIVTTVKTVLSLLG